MFLLDKIDMKFEYWCISFIAICFSPCSFAFLNRNGSIDWQSVPLTKAIRLGTKHVQALVEAVHEDNRHFEIKESNSDNGTDGAYHTTTTTYTLLEDTKYFSLDHPVVERNIIRKLSKYIVSIFHLHSSLTMC